MTGRKRKEQQTASVTDMGMARIRFVKEKSSRRNAVALPRRAAGSDLACGA